MGFDGGGAQGVDILLGGIPAQPYAQRAVDTPRVQPHGLQHVTPPAFFAGGAF